MYRIYEEKIRKWIDGSKKALLIYGARQVGKTYLIRKMMEQSGLSYAEYNLIEREDILSMLEAEHDAGEISRRLALYAETPLELGKSVIFIDEIQKYPDIITKIKYLVEEGKYRYVLSGSNLGVELKGLKSMPIGYVDMWQMYPLTYREFVKAIGISDDVMDHIKECFKGEKPVDEIIHQKLIKSFYYYLIVGGMPAAINAYKEEQVLERVNEEQQSIIDQYKADFTKYEAENRRLKIISVYDSIPSQLNKQNRKFSFTLLNKELKFDRYEESFLWLKDAAVAIPSYIAAEPKSPLEMSKATNVFKLFLSDVGLLTSCYPISVKKDLLLMDPEKMINNGSLFENYVAQEIRATGLEPYYYKREKLGEVDFLIEGENGPVPIEVKSGSDYKKHASLNKMLENYSFDKAYVVSTNNVEKEDGITYVPIYMTSLICKSEDETLTKIPKIEI